MIPIIAAALDSIELTITEISSMLGWVVAVAALAFTAAQYSRSKSKDIVSDSQRIVRIDARTEAMEKNLIKLEATMEKTDEKVEKMGCDLVRVDASVKSAHRRLDAAGIGKAE